MILRVNTVNCPLIRLRRIALYKFVLIDWQLNSVKQQRNFVSVLDNKTNLVYICVWRSKILRDNFKQFLKINEFPSGIIFLAHPVHLVGSTWFCSVTDGQTDTLLVANMHYITQLLCRWP